MPLSNGFAAALSGVLVSRSEEIARRWMEELGARLQVRPRSVFPTDRLLDHVPGLVRWVVGSASVSPRVPDDVVGTLRGLVALRLEQGHLQEEILVELAVLEEIVFDEALHEAASRTGQPLAAIGLSRAIALRMTRLQALSSGLYNEAVGDARRRDRLELEDFTRMVSHEMRTPISAAYTAALMLEEVGDELPADDRERMLEIVGRGLHRATRLLESVMSLTLARSTEPERTRSLRDVVGDAVAEATAGAGAVVLEVTTAVPSVPVDGRRVGLALRNLLSNAVKYADPSKDRCWTRISVERDNERSGWILKVTDNGVGIPRAEQEKVFHRFYRAHAELADGTGLGLVIAREAVEQAGGEIALESVPGVGSTFVVRLPDLEGRAGGGGTLSSAS